MLLGLRLLLLIGPTVPLPAPPTIGECLRSVQITEKDEGRSGFQMVFETGRGGPWDLLDYPLLAAPQLRAFSRVILVGQIGMGAEVLMDGIITNRTLSPGAQPGATTLTLTGEDLGLWLDMEERQVEHPLPEDTLIVARVLAPYLSRGLVPMVLPPMIPNPSLPIERIPTQQGTDLEYLRKLAERVGHVFQIEPGPAPGISTAYWGPPKRIGIPQPALSVDLGPATNVLSMRFETNHLAPISVSGQVADARTGTTQPVFALPPMRPPLVPLPAWLANQPNVRARLLPSGTEGGFIGAMVRAQGMVDTANDGVVTASGEVDVARYGRLLRPRAVVGVRGAGFTHDGLYFVKSVTHKISRGQYRQDFTLTREGDGSLTPVLPT